MNMQDCEAIRPALAEALLGGLDSADTLAAKEHVAVCVPCRDALAAEAELVSQALLADADTSLTAPPTVKTRLMQAVKQVRQMPAGVRYDQGGLLIISGPKVAWRETGIPGFQWRPLASCHVDDRTMAVYQLKAGACIPEHRHDGVEELFLLSGSLLVQGVPMNPGDYCRADSGSMHSPATAITDCEFLMSAEPVTFT